MGNISLLFKKYLAANSGDKEAMWFIIRRFEKYIDYECGGNMDLKHTIIVNLFNFSGSLDKKFEEFYEEISK